MDCEVYIKTSAKQLQIIFVFYFYKAKFRKVGYSCFCRCTLIQRVITQPWLGNTSAACIGRRWLSQPSETCQRQKRILSEFQRGIEKPSQKRNSWVGKLHEFFQSRKLVFAITVWYIHLCQCWRLKTHSETKKRKKSTNSSETNTVKWHALSPIKVSAAIRFLPPFSVSWFAMGPQPSCALCQFNQALNIESVLLKIFPSKPRPDCCKVNVWQNREGSIDGLLSIDLHVRQERKGFAWAYTLTLACQA